MSLLSRVSASFGNLANLGTRPPSPADGSITPPKRSQTSSDLEKTLGLIITQAEIPRDYVDPVSKKLRSILQNPKHRDYDELTALAGHVCVKDYLRSVFELLRSQIALVEKSSTQFKAGPDRDQFLSETQHQIDIYYTSIANLLGEGYDRVIKENLIFDKYNNPIGVREKDIPRFSACNRALTRYEMGGKQKRRITKKKQVRKSKTLRRKRNRNMH
jgi:hypothetical protein